jgi:hypothetical protein
VRSNVNEIHQVWDHRDDNNVTAVRQQQRQPPILELTMNMMNGGNTVSSGGPTEPLMTELEKSRYDGYINYTRSNVQEVRDQAMTTFVQIFKKNVFQVMKFISLKDEEGDGGDVDMMLEMISIPPHIRHDFWKQFKRYIREEINTRRNNVMGDIKRKFIGKKF